MIILLKTLILVILADASLGLPAPSADQPPVSGTFVLTKRALDAMTLTDADANDSPKTHNNANNNVKSDSYRPRNVDRSITHRNKAHHKKFHSSAMDDSQPSPSRTMGSTSSSNSKSFGRHGRHDIFDTPISSNPDISGYTGGNSGASIDGISQSGSVDVNSGTSGDASSDPSIDTDDEDNLETDGDDGDDLETDEDDGDDSETDGDDGDDSETDGDDEDDL